MTDFFVLRAPMTSDRTKKHSKKECLLKGGRELINYSSKKHINIDMLCVGREGVEPSRCHHRRILSPLRLPIPPPPQRIFNFIAFEYIVK